MPVPRLYYITAVLNARPAARGASAQGFVSEAAAEKALDQRTYLAHQVTRALPLAICIHPLLYMAVVPSLTAAANAAGRDTDPKGHPCSSQALLPQRHSNPQTSELQSPELSP